MSPRACYASAFLRNVPGKFCLLLVAVFGAVVSPVLAATYFVSPSGSNSNNGLSTSAPFATIQYAVNKSVYGDTITIMNGNYSESVQINTSGLTIQAQNPLKVYMVTTNGNNSFTIGSSTALSASNITINGLDMAATGTYASGVASAYAAHHITVSNCYVHDCGSNGISLNDGDYRVVQNNICARNAWLMPYAGSGISLWGRVQSDSAPGFHNILSGNICYGNDNGPTVPVQSDGNGLTIDDQRNTQSQHTGPAVKDINYAGSDTLIENNICFNNGGRGIQAYASNNITVVNNTCFDNCTRNDGSQARGEIEMYCTNDVTMANNIASTTTGTASNPSGIYNTPFYAGGSTGDLYGSNFTYLNNVAYDSNNSATIPVKIIQVTGTQPQFTGNGNITGTNPGFLNAIGNSALANKNLSQTTNFAADFGLAVTSPGIDSAAASFTIWSGTMINAPATDLAGVARPQGAGYDMGAYERLGSMITTSAQPAPGGTTTGGGSYVDGLNATVVATPASGYGFVNWTASGIPVSTSPSYTFTVANNGSLVANFQMTYASWEAAHFSAAEQANPTISGPAANPSGDGMSNLAKYAFGGDPKVANVSILPKCAIESGALTLTYTCNTSISDVTYTVQVSGDLSHWVSGSSYTSSLVISSTGTTETIQASDLTPDTSASRRFMRVLLSLPPG